MSKKRGLGDSHALASLLGACLGTACFSRTLEPGAGPMPMDGDATAHAPVQATMRGLPDVDAASSTGSASGPESADARPIPIASTEGDGGTIAPSSADAGAASGGSAPGGGADGSGAGLPPLELAPLRAACAGVQYRAQLARSDGKPVSSWVLLSALPDDLVFDASSGALSGTPHAAVRFRVALGKADGGSAPIDVDLALRDSCWFARLIASDASDPQSAYELHVSDVFLASDVTVGASASVVDFRFSPDGGWIAFRSGAAGGEQLSVVAVSSLTPQPGVATQLPPTPVVPFQCASGANGSCAVQEYAWSPDSARIAVVLRDSDSGKDSLSGLDLDAPDAPWPAVASRIWEGAEQELGFAEQVTWGGADWFGFWGLASGVPASAYEVFHFAFVAAGGLRSVEALSSELGGGPQLRAVPSGLAASYVDSLVIDELRPNSDGTGVLPQPLPGTVLSPSGRLAGFASDESRLELRTLDGGTSQLAESDPGACDGIVAWSQRIEPSGAERILCTAGTRLRLLDFVPRAPGSSGTASGLLASIDPAAGTDIGAAGDLLATPRLFSPSGRFLLLADAGTGQLAIIDSFTGAVDSDGLPFRLPAEMGFAPTRDAVTFADAQALIEYSLPRTLGLSQGYLTNGGAVPALGPLCEESFLTDPVRWCGSPALAMHWLYSPRSESLLFEGPSGVLSLADVSVLPGLEALSVPGALRSCPNPCRNKPYAFQPQAAPPPR